MSPLTARQLAIVEFAAVNIPRYAWLMPYLREPADSRHPRRRRRVMMLALRVAAAIAFGAATGLSPACACHDYFVLIPAARSQVYGVPLVRLRTAGGDEVRSPLTGEIFDKLLAGRLVAAHEAPPSVSAWRPADARSPAAAQDRQPAARRRHKW